MPLLPAFSPADGQAPDRLPQVGVDREADVYKVVVKPGATAFIPAGWIHAVVRICSTDFAWQRLWQD
jgi:oxalate decarboxylase/phosphoglucose isomerase-like protein (cupin superfamily)